MRIFVFGNINSGKTSLCNLLNELLPNYSVFSIDKFRQKYGKGDFESVLLAQNNFVKTVSNTKDGIIEATGLEPLGNKLVNITNFKSDIILNVQTPLDIFLDRIKFKDFSAIPYPPFEETLENTIIRCNYEFIKGYLELLWLDKVQNIITFNRSI